MSKTKEIADENPEREIRPRNCPVFPLREAVVLALDDQPLMVRLEFVRNMIAASGGEKGSTQQDPNLVVASEVLKATIEILGTYPKVAMARCEADEPAPVRPPRKKKRPNPRVARNH
jgi:hypothetical protein